LGKFPSFFAFKEGILDTKISVLGGLPTVSHECLSPPRMKIERLFSAEYQL
jgi:hypothetical protein